MADHQQTVAVTDPIKVGFAQTGSESGWRSANTESMKAAFSEENGFDLIFNAADNDPAAQIAAVVSFISQGVDAIVIAPIVSDGWDDVLQEAQDADIPVILEDRTLSASDDPVRELGRPGLQEGRRHRRYVGRRELR